MLPGGCCSDSSGDPFKRCNYIMAFNLVPDELKVKVISRLYFLTKLDY